MFDFRMNGEFYEVPDVGFLQSRAEFGQTIGNRDAVSIGLNFYGRNGMLHWSDNIEHAARIVDRTFRNYLGEIKPEDNCFVQVGRERSNLALENHSTILALGEPFKALMESGILYTTDRTSGKHSAMLKDETPGERLKRTHGEFVYFDSRINDMSNLEHVGSKVYRLK